MTKRVIVAVVIPDDLTLPEALDTAAQFAYRSDSTAQFEFGEPRRLFRAWYQQVSPGGYRAAVCIEHSAADGQPCRWVPIPRDYNRWGELKLDIDLLGRE